jgi:hypothetical protein
MNLTIHSDFRKSNDRLTNYKQMYKCKTNLNSPNISNQFEYSATSLDKRLKQPSSLTVQSFCNSIPVRKTFVRVITSLQNTVEDLEKKINHSKSRSVMSKFLLDYNSLKVLRKKPVKPAIQEDDQNLEIRLSKRLPTRMEDGRIELFTKRSPTADISRETLKAAIKDVAISPIPKVSSSSGKQNYLLTIEKNLKNIDNVKQDLDKAFAGKRYFKRAPGHKSFENYFDTLQSNIGFYIKYKNYANEKNVFKLLIEDYDLCDEIKTKKIGVSKPGNMLHQDGHVVTFNPRYVKTKFKKQIHLNVSPKLPLVNL